MSKTFTALGPLQIKDNPFKLIGADWMLITAGDKKKFNMMTASWGGCGVLWNKNVCFCFIRPVRYTYEFMERAENFTLSFFDKKYKSVLELCGAKSGRDIDKAKETGLTPVYEGQASVYFQEARLVIVCKKIYFSQIDPKNFLEASIEENYPKKDYHRMYVGSIIKVLQKEERKT
jgi:flavin reductase (DIM6/NTAB) family NADH-FMN oxidoreductase RutF